MQLKTILVEKSVKWMKSITIGPNTFEHVENYNEIQRPNFRSQLLEHSPVAAWSSSSAKNALQVQRSVRNEPESALKYKVRLLFIIILSSALVTGSIYGKQFDRNAINGLFISSGRCHLILDKND